MRTSRAEAKQRTREAVLEAAKRVFARDGFHGATLDRVALEAGFTKGAVYSAFDSKADLFLAVYEARIDERIARVGALRLDSFEAAMRAAAQEWRGVLRSERTWSAALTEFWVHAGRDDVLRERFGATHRRWRGAMASKIEQAAAAEGRALPGRGTDVATAIIALGNGLALEGLLGEEQDELFDAMIERVLR